MEEPLDRPRRVRRCRPHLTPSRTRQEEAAWPRSGKTLWAVPAAIAFALCVLLLMTGQTGVGVGAVAPFFTMTGGWVSIKNVSGELWTGVSVHAFSLADDTGDGLDSMAPGQSTWLPHVNAAPSLIFVRTSRPDGFWLGFAY